jgi:outer membrane protein assembly factor BamD (BamD/ComL family)
MRLLRRARSALNDGDPTQALARLTVHAETFARGQMVEDREALRVQALCKAGREAEARAAATAFLARYPNSPHAARVQRICAAG